MLDVILGLVLFTAMWAFLVSRNNLDNAPGVGKFKDYFVNLLPIFAVILVVGLLIALAFGE